MVLARVHYTMVFGPSGLCLDFFGTMLSFIFPILKNDIAKAIDVLIVMFQTLSAFSTQESELDFLMEAVIMRYE